MWPPAITKPPGNGHYTNQGNHTGLPLPHGRDGGEVVLHNCQVGVAVGKEVFEDVHGFLGIFTCLLQFTKGLIDCR